MSSEEFQDEFDSQIDLTSEPPQLATYRSNQRPKIAAGETRPVSIYFGCCRVTATLKPPQHVMSGASDLWRVHCPRCGGLIEVLVQ